MAKTQPPSSMFFCFKCFTGLLIPLANNQLVDFEKEESLQNYFEQKCVCYGFYKSYQIWFENWLFLMLCSMQVFPQAETDNELMGYMGFVKFVF